MSTRNHLAPRGSGVCPACSTSCKLRQIASPIREAHSCTIECALATRITHPPDAAFSMPPPTVDWLWRKRSRNVATTAYNVASGEYVSRSTRNRLAPRGSGVGPACSTNCELRQTSVTHIIVRWNAHWRTELLTSQMQRCWRRHRPSHICGGNAGTTSHQP